MKTVVVTGSSKGIGLGLANEFLKKGCNVVLSSFAKDEMMHEYEKACAIYGKNAWPRRPAMSAVLISSGSSGRPRRARLARWISG